MTPQDLLLIRTVNPDDSNAVFAAVSIVSKYALEFGASDKFALDAIIRLREAINSGRIRDQGLVDAVYALCREAGLFPYLDPLTLNWREKVAYEFFRGPDQLNYVFHREQWQAFQVLLSGKSLILSAPTSFGKSVLIHAYIAEKKPFCVVVLVPTIALLDQFRRRLSEQFSNEYAIITRNDQKPSEDEKRIYVLTQERLLDRNDIRKIDLLAIDEYYKLDRGRESKNNANRASLLNVALRRYLNFADQIFFLGPTVASVAMRDELRPRFAEFPSTITTVAADIEDCKGAAEPYKLLASLLAKYSGDKSLIYSKSPPSARTLVRYLMRKCPLPVGDEIREFADWLAEHYHPSWILVAALRAGYGLHHGSIPRSIAQALVRYFNEGSLNALICTSTLIEGVNTAAKNVFVLDKKISTSNYDYFDFRNIAGRSGRMGHHFVGRIFLFNEPPEPEEVEIRVPALGKDSDLPDDVILNLPDEILSRDLILRKQRMIGDSGLPYELIKRFASYGVGSIDRVSDKIVRLLDSGDRSLLWRGSKKYEEIYAVFRVAWDDLQFNKKRLSAESAAFYANRLRGAQILRVFFDRLVQEKDELEHIEIIERGFRALNLFDYSLPKLLLDMEALVNYHCRSRGLDDVDYSFMAYQLDNCCCHHWIKACDEYGVPLPLGRKIQFLVRDVPTLEAAIDAIRTYRESTAGERRLSPFELSLIGAALD